MEVQGRQPNEPTPAERRYLEAKRERFQSDRERVRSGREERLSGASGAGENRSASATGSNEATAAGRAQGGDRLEISSTETLTPAETRERGERVAELRRLYDAGQLNQPERIEKAALGLLHGSEF